MSHHYQHHHIFKALHLRAERLLAFVRPEVSYERVIASKTHIATCQRWNSEIPRSREELYARRARNTRKIRAISAVSDMVFLPITMVSLAMVLTLIMMKLLSITFARDMVVAVLALITLIVAIYAWSLARAMCAHIERQSGILASMRCGDEN